MKGFARSAAAVGAAFLGGLVLAGCGGSYGSADPASSPLSSAKTRWVAARIDPLPTRTVVLSRSWTPAVLTEMSNRLDPHRGISVKTVYRRHVPLGNPKGWWFVWTDPTRNSQAQGMRDYWTAQVLGRLYQAQRVLSAPKLSGIQLKTQVPSTDSDWAAGENSRWWGGHTRVYFQARAAALRTHIRRRAANLGLALSSFSAPRLGGILAPVVTLRVSDDARFKRWFVPGCAEGYLLGPRAGTNGSPYFGSFLTVDDSAGNWLESAGAYPNGAETELSSEMHALFPPRVSPGQVGGIAACPNRFR